MELRILGRLYSKIGICSTEIGIGDRFFLRRRWISISKTESRGLIEVHVVPASPFGLFALRPLDYPVLLRWGREPRAPGGQTLRSEAERRPLAFPITSIRSQALEGV